METKNYVGRIYRWIGKLVSVFVCVLQLLGLGLLGCGKKDRFTFLKIFGIDRSDAMVGWYLNQAFGGLS